MYEQNTDEIRYRRKAFKFFELGKSPVEILACIPRSRAWLFKWKRRFQEQGWQALESLPKTPRLSPQAYSSKTVRLVVQTRQRMEKNSVGLVSARALQQELLRHRLLKAVPSQTTIKRWLREAGILGHSPTTVREAYYPALPPKSETVIFSFDWTARYLTGGEKVFVFHSLDLQTRALAQTICSDKSADSACDHLRRACVEIGLPDFVRLDNDAAFTGLGRYGRQFGKFLRTALYLGIELLFIPPGEPKRNHDVERVNGLWAGSFWNKNHFRSRAELLRKSPKFLTWYHQTYKPPPLNGLTASQAMLQSPRRYLSEKQIANLPDELPLTAGRLHFVRRVSPSGEIQILKEQWKVSRTLAREYVLATLELEREELTIYHRRSTRSEAHQVCCYEYQIAETIKQLSKQYQRSSPRLDMLEII